ncbi:helix-turn-helix domain-containing protein [Methylobacterium nonmethylotrophicum]|nr:helix-turn-helix domain-containing protein [Methylobacterium nonmethylotrophicum]
MLRACTGRRRTSRLPQLVDLFVGTPLVTVASAARALSVSPQAVEGMLAELGPARPRELTERRRYRAWGDRVRASRLRRRLMMWSPHTWRSKSIR